MRTAELPVAEQTSRATPCLFIQWRLELLAPKHSLGVSRTWVQTPERVRAGHVPVGKMPDLPLSFLIHEMDLGERMAEPNGHLCPLGPFGVVWVRLFLFTLSDQFVLVKTEGRHLQFYIPRLSEIMWFPTFPV